MRCALCGEAMAYVHGHAACVRSACPMFGVNQAECCDGETQANCPVPTAHLRAAGDALVRAGRDDDDPPRED